jgi:hypothetical protein
MSKPSQSLLVSFFLILDCVLLVFIAFVLTGRIRVVYDPNQSLSQNTLTIPDTIREEVNCQAVLNGTTMVALSIGQSNAANLGESIMKAPEGVYNFHDGKCFKAVDPMLGASGTSGSVWTRLGKKLITEEHYDSVLFITISQSGSSVAQWTPDREFGQLLLDTINQVRNSGLEITHILWHQGEADNHLKRDKERYKSLFNEMVLSIRNTGVAAPIFVSIASKGKDFPASNEIQTAQHELVDQSLLVLRGPDTDQLGNEYRRDECHFNDKGLDVFAALWMEIILSNAI